ncbi:MAG: T9SS type A sorting domain-containing protein [Bacteroidota bacterium]
MLRVACILALFSGLVSLSAHRVEKPIFGACPFAVNSTVAEFFLPGSRLAPQGSLSVEGSEADTSTLVRVLMLNYSAYDSAYANKVHRLVQRNISNCAVSDFWDGSAEDLSNALIGQDAVVITYPSGGTTATIKAFGKVLAQFVRQGGGVVFTGTHEFSILQQYGLFDLDFGYFCATPAIHAQLHDHPVTSGLPADFELQNYAYPLDISDPGFTSLADVRGYPVLGYKMLGAGKVVYLGLEYYYEEPEPARLLANALRWIAQSKPQPTTTTASISANVEAWQARGPKRSEETLRAGSGWAKNDVFDLKVYPNPYVSKATLDIDLTKPATVEADMSDETGQIVAVLLPRKSLNTGLYRIEIPNLPPGVYFVQCRAGEKNMTKKLVKTTGH